jgi:hypothetical protein
MTTRSDFARDMSNVREGMSASDVEALLGEPDDIRTTHDSLGGIVTYRTKAIWCYGTDGHLTTPTLGSVYLDEQDRVQFVFGVGPALPEGLFDEDELRRLLRVLDRVPPYNAADAFDPLRLIRAVNALQPLGKERALAVIAEYLRIATEYADCGRKGMFLVLRLLFDIPEEAGGQPDMWVGAPCGPQPQCPADAPRYPLVLCGDIPLLAVHGYTLRGSRQDPADHLEHFREHGQLREQLLTPTDRPFSCLEEPETRWPWMFPSGVGPDGRRLLAMQVLNLVGTVYRPVLNDWGHPAPYHGWQGNSPGYPEDITAISRLVVRWNPARELYTFPDGSFLPEEGPVNYRTEFWECDLPGVEVKIAVARENHCFVSFRLNIEVVSNRVLAQRLEVYSDQVTDRPACVMPLVGPRLTAPEWGGSTSGGVVLPLGHELCLRVMAGKDSKLSPRFRP